MINYFKAPHDSPTGMGSTLQSERLAERLNGMWFKTVAAKFGTATRLGKFLTDLNERVLKLEQAAKPTQPSSMNRTATGVADMNANWRLPKYDPPVEVAVINRDERVLLRSVRKFRENNSIVSFVYLDGLQIEIKRDPNV